MLEQNTEKRIKGLGRLIGNTGISFAGIGRALGHPVTIFMPDWMSEERKNLIHSLGAEIILVSEEEGGFLAPHVELMGFSAFKRVCYTCCDPEECMESKNKDLESEIVLPLCPRREC